MNYHRSQEELLQLRLSEDVDFINLLAGPRQVGKTTIIRHLISLKPAQGYYISVDDEPSFSDSVCPSILIYPLLLVYACHFNQCSKTITSVLQASSFPQLANQRLFVAKV